MSDLPPPNEPSPTWSSQLKIVFGMVLVVALLAFAFYFRAIIGPLLMTFIITYLLYPVIASLSRLTRLSWQFTANLVFLGLLALFASLFTVTGVALVQQVQSLIGTIQNFSGQVPQLLQQISSLTLTFGSSQINIGQAFNLTSLSTDLLNTIQTIIGKAGDVVSPIASGAASTLGWTFFVLLLSYFVLVDAGELPNSLKNIHIPGYEMDLRRIVQELGRIWNSFLRGQVIIVTLMIAAYSVMLNILGLRYAFGLAALAGLARFVPYVGPLTTNTITFVVAFVQPDNIYHLDSLPYAVTVIICMLVLDQIFDNLINPRILGQTLGVHPAGVLIAAIVATNLIGFIGLLLAAPVLATFQLLGRYIFRKMFDLDPWPKEPERDPALNIPPLKRIWRMLIVRLRRRA